MRIFDVSNCTSNIVRPGMTLSEWSATKQPFAVCNASLYDMRTRVPIGTIVEDGKFVHNDGNGFGCGVTWTDGHLQFGQPWDKAWKEYLTGYNAPVQGGQYVAPTWTDTYVFGCRLVRIGVGRKGDKTVIVTDDLVTLREFAEHAISNGLDTLVNLDGGGSRHLYYNGATVYSSPRVPYNAIAFYGGAPTEKPKPEVGQCPYPEPTKNLMLGSRGDGVKWMQWHLKRKGYDCGVDGVFGWQTWNALWRFQKTWSRSPDGICGPITRGELKK